MWLWNVTQSQWDNSPTHNCNCLLRKQNKNHQKRENNAALQVQQYLLHYNLGIKIGPARSKIILNPIPTHMSAKQDFLWMDE